MQLVEVFKPKYLVLTHDEEKSKNTTGLLASALTWVSAEVEDAVEALNRKGLNTRVVDVENGGEFKLN
jgi:hypothetical protein